MKTEVSFRKLVWASITIIFVLAFTSSHAEDEYEVSYNFYEGSDYSEDIYNDHVSADTSIVKQKYQSSSNYGMSSWVHRRANSHVNIDAKQTAGSWSAQQSAEAWGMYIHTWEWSGPPGTAPSVTCDYDYEAFGWANASGRIYYPDQGSALIAGSADATWSLSGDDSFYTDASTSGWASSNETSWNSASISMSPYQGDGWDCDWDTNSNDSEFWADADVLDIEASDSYQATGGSITITTCADTESYVSGNLTSSSGSYTYLTVDGTNYCSTSGSASLDY